MHVTPQTDDGWVTRVETGPGRLLTIDVEFPVSPEFLDQVKDRLFELAPADPTAPVELVRTPRQLKYAYRGLEVKERMEELGFGTAVVKLDLDYVIKSSGGHGHGANC